MKIRTSRLRILGVAFLLVAGMSSLARASSISMTDAGPAILKSPSPPASGSMLVLPERQLSLAGATDSDAGLELAAASALTGLPSQKSLLLNGSKELVVTANLGPAAPSYLSAALPFTVSDVPEPTAFGLLFLGLCGLLAARRVARKA